MAKAKKKEARGSETPEQKKIQKEIAFMEKEIFDLKNKIFLLKLRFHDIRK